MLISMLMPLFIGRKASIRLNSTRLRAVLLALMASAMAHQAAVAQVEQRTERKVQLTSLHGSASQNISRCVVAEAYRSLGYQVQIKEFSTYESIIMAGTHLYDGESSRVKSVGGKVKGLHMINSPVIFMKGVAITKGKKLSINGFDSLKQYKVVINRGAVFSLDGTEGFPLLSLASNYKSALSMVNAEVSDVAILTYSTWLKLSKLKEFESLTLQQPEIIKIPMYHFVNSEKNAHLIPALEVAFKDMLESGRTEEVYKNYIKAIVNNSRVKVKTPLKTNYSCPARPEKW